MTLCYEELDIFKDFKVTAVEMINLLKYNLMFRFAALYNCPLIWSYSMGAHWLVMRLLDDPTNPAYASDYMMPINPPFSFFQRFKVLWHQLMWRYAKL